MHPILFEFGPIQIRYYGLMYAISILCALPLMHHEIRRKHIQLSEEDTMNFLILCVMGGILGARLYYVMFNWASYRQELSEIFKVWHGGLAIHGGILGGVLVGWLLTRRHRIPFWRMADVAALPLMLAQTFGRFGNFMNGDAHGTITTMPWGIVFPYGPASAGELHGKPLHPVMLYEMACNFGIFLLLWRLRTTPRKDGFLFCLYLLLYSVARFVVSFFRADNLMVAQFSLPHIVSILLILGAGGWIVARRLWEAPDNATICQT